MTTRVSIASQPLRNESQGIKAATTGGAINGKVLDAESGAPIAGFFIFAADVATRAAYFGADSLSASDGAFTISGVPDGDYYLDTYPLDTNSLHVDTWYPDVWDFDFWNNLRSATPIRISGSNTVNIEFRLKRGTRFVFNVRDGSGQPVDSNSQDPGCVGKALLGNAYADSGAAALPFQQGNCSIIDDRNGGVYSLVPIPVGRKIWLNLWPEGFDFLPIFHDGKATIAESTPLVASAVGEIPVNVTLSARGPTISGNARFQSVSLSTITRRLAQLYSADNRFVRGSGVAADGSVSLGGIPDGDYKLRYLVRGRVGANPVQTYSKFYRNASSLAGATHISVRGANVTGIDVLMDTPPDILQIGGDWSGTYVDRISCGGTTFDSQGTAVFNLTQSGTSVNGSGSLVDRKNILGSCAASGTTTIIGSINGALNGASFTGTFNTNLGSLPLQGTFGAVSFTGTLTYPNGTSILTLRGSAARIDSFVATPSKIRLGESATLSWKTSNSVSVTISGIAGPQPPTGSITVSPTATTTYTLTAGSSTTPPVAQVSVEVVAVPVISAATLPNALVQAAGESGAVTSYTLINSGGAAASITLSQSGSFFVQEPSSFTLASGATQVVMIRGTQQDVGSYEGASFPSGAGVRSELTIPVRLLVVAPPTSGSASAQSQESRVDLAALPSEEPRGTVPFQNQGTAMLIGMLSADVPWIRFENVTVAIGPGETVEVPFSIDRSQRPDAESPIGSVTGTIRLSYLAGSGSQGKLGVTDGGSVTSSATVAVVDTATLQTNSAVLVKLAPGEIARFIPRVSHVRVGNSVVATDITVSRAVGTSTVNDLRLFYTPSTQPANAIIANLGALGPSQSLYLGNVVKSIFGKQSEVGSLQLRSIDWQKLVLQARSVNLGSARPGLGTEVPVFRSDRAAGAGEKLYFAGLRRDARTFASIYLQEASGSPAAISIELLDAAGSVVGTRNETIPPFGLLELNDVVPIGALTAVVNHTETSGGQVVGYVAMSDSITGDSWTVTDWARYFGYKNSDAVRMPLVESSAGARRRPARRSENVNAVEAAKTELTLFNPGASVASATLGFTDSSGRTLTRSVSVEARKSLVISDAVAFVGGSGRGSLLVTPTAGALVVSAGLATGGSASYAATLPALASSSGLKLGDAISFANLEDSSASTILARTPGTLRTSFGIVETGGGTAKVRATLTYADGTTPVSATLARNFNVTAGQQLMFDSIAAAIIGPSRAFLGDLRNVQVSFQVLEGAGTATIFVRSTDNASGDSIVRVE